MRLVKVAAVSVSQEVGGWIFNKENLRNALRQARAAGASIVCTPEFSITGYSLFDLLNRKGIAEMALNVLKELLSETHGMLVTFGLPFRVGAAVYNAVVYVLDGKPVGITFKRDLADDGVYFEHRNIKAWPEGERTTVSLFGHEIPAGDIYFEWDGVRVQTEECEEAFTERRQVFRRAGRSVDFTLNPSASHAEIGKSFKRELLANSASLNCGTVYVYASLGGGESGTLIFDGELLVSVKGEVVARNLHRYSYRRFSVVTATVDVDSVRNSLVTRASFRPDHTFDPALVKLGNVPAIVPAEAPIAQLVARPAWETAPDAPFEEMSRAVPMALHHYIRTRRGGTKGFVISLSGGSDSTASGELVSLWVKQGIAELGLEGFLADLSFLKSIQGKESAREIIGETLFCLYQGTANSTADTLESARLAAEGWGAKFGNIDIEGRFQTTKRDLEALLGVELTWDKHDLPLQNIQPRERVSTPWGLANVLDFAFLNTSNMTEADIGYTSLDGDSSGILSIIPVDKPFLMTWIAWMRDKGPEGIGPSAYLLKCSGLRPSAELRPGFGQYDDLDLAPYPIIQRIIQLGFAEFLDPVEVFQMMYPELRMQVKKAQLAVWIKRFFTLFTASQVKRRKFANSFHILGRNADPTSFARYPINVSTEFWKPFFGILDLYVEDL